MYTFIRYFTVAILLGCLCSACEKDYFVDGGKADGNFDGTVWEYLRNSHGNWDSLVVAIEHAGIIDVFDNPNAPVTLFGPTNNSINQFLFKTVDENGNRLYQGVKDIPADLCRRMVLSYVIEGVKMRTDFDYEVKGTLDGGTLLQSLSGAKLRVFRRKTDYGTIPDAGAEELYIHAKASGHIVLIVSGDIKPTNGVVHALSTTHQWTKF